MISEMLLLLLVIYKLYFILVNLFIILDITADIIPPFSTLTPVEIIPEEIGKPMRFAKVLEDVERAIASLFFTVLAIALPNFAESSGVISVFMANLATL